MKIRYLTSLLFLMAICLVHGRSIRQPQMPRGLSSDKTSHYLKPQQEPIKSTAKQCKVKRKGLQGYRKYHTLSQMEYDELKEAIEREKKAKNWDIVCKYLERMIILLSDRINEKAVFILELADILFTQQKYDEASKWYTEFTQLYPGNKHIEYASYKAIVCASKNILSIDRDQSPTEKTLDLTNAFLKRSDVFKTYKDAVLKIQHECYQLLAQSDCNIAEFYLIHGSYKAAERRLKSIRDTWITKVPEITIKLANLEHELSLQWNDFKAPESSIKLAQATRPTKKVDMTTRF